MKIFVSIISLVCLVTIFDLISLGNAFSLQSIFRSISSQSISDSESESESESKSKSELEPKSKPKIMSCYSCDSKFQAECANSQLNSEEIQLEKCTSLDFICVKIINDNGTVDRYCGGEYELKACQQLPDRCKFCTDVGCNGDENKLKNQSIEPFTRP